VRYRPEDPRRARIASLQDDWFFPGVLAGFAMLWLLPGVMALRARWIFLRRGGGVAAAREGEALPQAVEPPGHGVPVPLAGLRREETAEGPRWFVQARWSDATGGATRLLESEPLRFDPVPQMRALTSVRVAFQADPAQGPYRMDLSFLRAPDADASGVQRRG